MKNANDQNFFNFVGGLRQRVIRYYNERDHSTAKVAPFRAMMNIENIDLIHKIRESTIKRRQKAMMVTETFLKNSIVRISNFIRLIYEKHIRFNPPRDYKKSVSKEELIVVGKIELLSCKNFRESI